MLLFFMFMKLQAKKDEKVAADLKDAATLLAHTHLEAVTKLAAETKEAALAVDKRTLNF